MNFKKGFSLIEVIIASAVVAGGALMMANFMTQSKLSMKSIEQSGAVGEITAQIRGFLSVSSICSGNFNNKNVGVQTAFTQLKDLNGAPRFATGQDFDGVEIKSISFGGTFVPLTGPTFGTTSLVLQFEKKIGNTPITVNKTIDLIVSTNGANIVTNCSTYNDANSGHWTKDESNNTLNYQLGSVSIGETADTDVPLKIKSTNSSKILRLKHSGGSIDLGASGSSHLLVQGKKMCQEDGTDCPSRVDCQIELIDCQNYTAGSFWCGPPTGTPGVYAGNESCVTTAGAVKRFRCPRDRIVNEVQTTIGANGNDYVNHVMCCKMRLRNCSLLHE